MNILDILACIMLRKSFYITEYQSYQSELRYWKSVKYFQRKAESEFYQLEIIFETLGFETTYLLIQSPNLLYLHILCDTLPCSCFGVGCHIIICNCQPYVVFSFAFREREQLISFVFFYDFCQTWSFSRKSISWQS